MKSTFESGRYSRANRETKARVDYMQTVLLWIEAAISGGLTVSGAVAAAGKEHGTSPSTLWEWRKRVKDVPRSQWKDALCHQSAAQSRKRFTKESEFFAIFLTDYYNRATTPTLAGAYRAALRDNRIRALAPEEIPSREAVRLLVERDVRRGLVARERVGPKAQRRTEPYQARDRSELRPYEIVTADGHKCDWLVEWEDGSTGRPELIVFADEYSGMLLGWDIDRAENANSVRRAAARTLLDYGKMRELLFDNGCGFIKGTLTAGSLNSYKRKPKEDEPDGAFVRLGVAVRFLPPGSPTSKRQERTFGLVENELRNDTTLDAGAYVGRSPEAQSEIAGTVAIPIAAFTAAAARAIDAVNDLPSRAANCNGRSRRETFYADGYSRNVFTTVSADEAAQFLLDSRVLTPNRDTFAVQILGNTYYEPTVAALIRRHTSPRKRSVLVFYDPRAGGLHDDGVYVYALDGRFLGHMPCRHPVGYRDVDAAKESKRALAEQRRLDRAEKQRLAKIAASVPPAELARFPEIAAKAARLSIASDAKAPDRLAVLRAAREASGAGPQRSVAGTIIDSRSAAIAALRIAKAGKEKKIG